jgi:hypothetical protein
MRLDWLSWTNPVAVWWCFLVIVSAGNIAWLFWLHSHFRSKRIATRGINKRRVSQKAMGRIGMFAVEPLVLLAAAYVFGCAFRSLLPRADVQRICLFDTWLSSIFVGRSVATIAELCFVMQWAIVLRALADIAHADTARNVSRMIVPLIVVAEAWSWYAVITTNYLGNVFENSLWTATFLLVAVALMRLVNRFHGVAKFAIAATAAGSVGYVAFMCTVDVPMYFGRWHAEVAHGREFFGLISGLHDAATRWIVTRDAARWQGEIIWMSLYFSMAVWASLLLGSFGMVRHLLPRYRVRQTISRPAGRRTSVPANPLLTP